MSVSNSGESKTEVAEGEVEPMKLKDRGATRRGKAKKVRTKKSFRKFPAVTLEQALAIPRAIKQYNAGNPWPSTEVSNALGIKHKTNTFWYLSSGARDYKITIGTRDTAQIEITALGRSIVYAKDPSEEAKAVRESLFNIEVFKAVYEHYQGGSLPEMKYLSNTLETQFGLPPESHVEFQEFYAANRAFLATAESVNGVVAPSINGANGQAVVVGEPKEKTSLRAFVIMPFSEKSDVHPKSFFLEVLSNLITPAGVDAGFKVETARRDGSDIIQSTIVNELLESDLVIADLTDHNPNVLFELGLRIAFEKPIALIRAEGTLPIFDVDAMLRVASYSPNLWKSTLSVDVPKITSHIKAAWETRKNPQTWLKLLKKA